MQANGPEALFDGQNAKSFDRLQRYAAHHQRAFDRALRTLRTLQSERLARRAAAGHQDPFPVHVPVAEIDKRTRQITKRTHSLVLIAGGAAVPGRGFTGGIAKRTHDSAPGANRGQGRKPP